MEVAHDAMKRMDAWWNERIMEDDLRNMMIHLRLSPLDITKLARPSRRNEKRRRRKNEAHLLSPPSFLSSTHKSTSISSPNPQIPIRGYHFLLLSAEALESVLGESEQESGKSARVWTRG